MFHGTCPLNMKTDDKTARWLDLIAFLLHHRFPVTREQVFGRVSGYLGAAAERQEGRAAERAFESARRQFERDKDELRAIGVEIETVPLTQAAGDEPATGYRLKPANFYLPYLELDRAGSGAERPYQGLRRVTLTGEELELLDRATQRLAARSELPLSDAATSLRRKLAFDLPLPEGSVERALAEPLEPEAGKALAVLQRAVADKVAVSCTYYTIGRDETGARDIEPYGLFFNWGRWYCVARARDRDALRVFRVDRMRTAQPQKGKQARFVVPGGFSIRDYLGRAPWSLSDAEPTTVRVRFTFPEARWVQAQEAGRVVESMLEDGGAILEFKVRDRPPFLRWLLTFRSHATVLGPADVASELCDLKREVAALYAD